MNAVAGRWYSAGQWRSSFVLLLLLLLLLFRPRRSHWQSRRPMGSDRATECGGRFSLAAAAGAASALGRRNPVLKKKKQKKTR